MTRIDAVCFLYFFARWEALKTRKTSHFCSHVWSNSSKPHGVGVFLPLHSPPLSIRSLIYMWTGYEINRNVAIITLSLVSLYVVSCDRWRHTHTHSLFSSFAAVGISKCVSGEIEVFIITLYRGKGEAFKVANWQKGWLLALSVLSLWRRRKKAPVKDKFY